MKVGAHTASDFFGAILALLPPGAAWDWPDGGFGAALVDGAAQEPARLDAEVQPLLDAAIDLHRPGEGGYHISRYQAVADEALAGVVETRKPLAVGAHVGDRVWSSAGADFPVPLVQVKHRIGPLMVGSHAGDRVWSAEGRFVLWVAYYRSVAKLDVIREALNAFRQAHVSLFFIDITGVGGVYASD